VGETENLHLAASEVPGQRHQRTTEDERGDPGRKQRSDDPCLGEMAIESPHHQGEGAKRRH